MIFLFLIEASRHKNKQFIIVGSTIGSVKRNILNEMERYLGKEIKLGKNNEFSLFGNTVTVFQGANADCWKTIRGMTSHLTMINEATAQHPETIREAFDRTSGDNAKILCDTNTENPMHYFKINYMDKNGERDSNGNLQVLVEHFTLFDNNFLSPEYIEMQTKIYQEGSVEYLRDIMGAWVGREGVIYPMFKKDRHIIDNMPTDTGVVKYIGAVDWGWEHNGVILILAKLRDGRFIVVDEVVEQHKDIDWWVNKAIELRDRYGVTIFYCDSARQEYVMAFNRAKINAINANKSVIEGISKVSQLFNEDKLFFLKDKTPKLIEEMYQYVWKSGDKEEPRKEFDDCQDALRYGIYTEKKINEQPTTLYQGIKSFKYNKR